MIVLDEQLLGRGIEVIIARWYPGSVCFITQLRPNTIIKDDAIPTLLQSEAQPMFVTINESDFWQKVKITEHFCVVCIAVADSRVDQIPALLQRLLRHPDFRTKAQRMGRVVRLTMTTASYYLLDSSTILPVEGW